MTDDQFDAHLALHGMVRYAGKVSLNAMELRRVYVDDEHLIDMFRDSAFVRIDQYGPQGMAIVEERAVPGFQEFGCAGQTVFYTRAKNK